MELKEKEIVYSSKLVDNSQDEDDKHLADDEDGEGNAGWADSIAQVLKTSKPKKKKTLVLSRAKKISQVKKEKKSYDFEIEGEVGEEPDRKEQNKDEKEVKFKPKLLLRVKPTIKDREREKALKKIATKGVVQLFNAVRIQQKDLNKQLKEAGPLDHRKDAVLNNINKRKFLDVLMGGERAKSELIDNPLKEEKIKSGSDNDDDEEGQNKKTQWSVLRDDFMTNKKLKHWDQEDSDADGNDKGSTGSDDLSSDNE